MTAPVESLPVEPEPDPRIAALQILVDVEQKVVGARYRRDRAVRELEDAESALAKVRADAADALGVHETDLEGLR